MGLTKSCIPHKMENLYEKETFDPLVTIDFNFWNYNFELITNLYLNDYSMLTRQKII